MSLNPFRSYGSRAAALATAAVIGAWSSFPAAAEQLGAKAPACDKIRNDLKAVQCGIRDIDRRIDSANQGAAEASRRAAEAERLAGCSLSLQAWVRGPKDKPYDAETLGKNVAALKVVLNGKSIRDVNDCEVLGKLKGKPAA